MTALNLASNPAALAQVLQMLCQGDTEVIKSGEKLLKPFLKKVDCIVALIAHLRTPTNDEPSRHQAALLLKKQVGKMYTKLSNPQHKTDLKVQMVQLMISEPSKPIRISICGGVANLAKAVFAHSEWSELFQLMMQLSQDPNEISRSLNYTLLEQLSETVSEKLKPHTATLAQMLTAGCQDPSPAVSVAAMKATTCYIRSINDDPEVMRLQSVLTPMLSVMHQCLARGDEDIVAEGLEVIQECAEMQQPLLNDHLEVVVPFLIQIMQNEEYDMKVQEAAGVTINSIIDSRPKLLAKKNLVGPVLQALMTMLARESTAGAGSLFSFNTISDTVHNNEDDDDEDDFDPEMDLQRMVQLTIDSLAMKVPSKHFVGPALALIGQGIVSPNPHMRKAACAVLGVISEGCCDAIRQRLPEILPPLLQSVQDPEFYVRECACFALGQFSEYCQPDILHYHHAVLPVIFAALDDSKETVQATACYVQEMFCENLQKETLRPFLVPLMTRLANLLQNPARNIQEMALTSIAATAIAAETDFLPFTETVCTLLMSSLYATDKSLFQLRGRSLECFGHIAVAVGKENFSRYFEAGMRSAVSAIDLKDDGLKEYSYVFFANGAKVMTREFDKFLPDLIPHLLEVIGESELTYIGRHDEDEEDEDDDEEEEAGDDDDCYVNLNIQDGFVNSKKAAITAIGALAEHTKEGFFPYLQGVMEKLLADGVGSIHSEHDVVKAESVLVLKDLVACAACAHGVTEAPVKGQVLTLHPFVSDLLCICVDNCITIIKEDPYKQPVASACESIIGMLDTLGASALAAMAEKANVLIECINTLLLEKAPCQTESNREQKNDEEDDDDHDNIISDSVSEVICALAKATGGGFVQYFDYFLRALMRYTKESRPYSDRSMAIGCFAEVFQEIEGLSCKYVDAMLPVLMRGLSDDMEAVRRNSAFCVGVLVEQCGPAVAPYHLSFLQWLHPVCSRKESQTGSDTGGADTDNALSAVSKMIKMSPETIPIDQVLPVMIAALPLRSDFSEGQTVYGCIIHLTASGNATAVALRPQIIEKLSLVLAPANTVDTPESKALVESFLKSI